MSVRAKFYVTTLEPYHPPATGQPAGGSVKLRPVYSQDPNHENKAFWDATPGGEISLQINNPSAFAFFAGKLSKEFYVDFSEAP